MLSGNEGQGPQCEAKTISNAHPKSQYGQINSIKIINLFNNTLMPTFEFMRRRRPIDLITVRRTRLRLACDQIGGRVRHAFSRHNPAATPTPAAWSALDAFLMFVTRGRSLRPRLGSRASLVASGSLSIPETDRIGS
jgi:hypothetical protein